VGPPDSRLGQVPVMAFLRRSGSETPSVDDMTAYLRARLSPYQSPTRILVVAGLPRTPALKIDQSALGRLFEAGTTA